MESSSSRNVIDLAADERHALEAILGRPLQTQQRVFVMAYTPSALPGTKEEDPDRILEKADQYILEHGDLSPESAAAIQEALRDTQPNLELLDANGRVIGRRITVNDVLTYAVNGRHPSGIAVTLGISTRHVHAALAYFVQHREEVLKGYRGALARIARGNPPEVEARRQQTHERLMEKLREIRQRRGA